MVQNNHKKVFFMLFFVNVGPLGHPQMDKKKVDKGLQVGGMYGPMSKLKDKPLTKSLGPLF